MTPGARTAQDGTAAQLRARYDRLWSGSIEKIRAGQVELDPVLTARVADARRGLTVTARPCLPVRERVQRWLDELRHLEPDQHYYSPSEFHVTVLSLFTATVEHGAFLAQTQRYLSALDSALRSAAALSIRFEGITASPGTVMIQGFLDGNGLNDLRDVLRRELSAGGLGAGLDQRYRLQTAHMTVARFRAPLRDSRRFAVALENARQRRFGTATIGGLRLVKNDWYMSRSVTETVKRYRLRVLG